MKIRHRLLLALVATSIATSVLVGPIAVRLIRSEVREHQVARLRTATDLVGLWVVDSPPGDSLQSVARRAASRIGTRVTLIAQDGTVLADSALDEDGVARMDNHAERPEVRAAEEAGTGESVRRSSTTGGSYLYSARRISGHGQVRFVRVAERAADTAAVKSRVFWLAVGIVLAVLAAMTAISYLVVRRMSAPIEAIAASAERAALGETRLDIPAPGDGEIGRLVRAIERARGTLLGKIEELEDERALLRAVVGGMREGLLLLGPDRRIRLANDAFRQSFRLAFEPEGHLLAEVVRNPALLRELSAALQDVSAPRDSILHVADSDRSYELHITPLEDKGTGAARGALVLFFDITRLEALEGVRKEFVANVSHELRTPLTSIRAFVETLLEERLEDRENSLKFLEIVRRHADRMQALIDDLTELSLMETASITLVRETVDARDVARETVAQLGPRYADLGVETVIDLPSPFPVCADRRRLEQVLVNLVDNAIKFNRRGGRVTLSGNRAAGRATLVVSDTGIGIPADSLDRVFHRFYRVDKARSREVGGTGLGLAIVKHIMRLHGGEVRLESELGRGATFTLVFPDIDLSDEDGGVEDA